MQKLESADDPIECVEIRQHSSVLHAPTKWLQEQILTGNIVFAKNELLEINFSNARCTEDTNLNKYVNKKRSVGKVDMVVSLINAVYLLPQEIHQRRLRRVCAVLGGYYGKNKGRFYDSRGYSHRKADKMTLIQGYFGIIELCHSDRYDLFLVDMEQRCLEEIGMLLRYNHNHDLGTRVGLQAVAGLTTAKKMLTN